MKKCILLSIILFTTILVSAQAKIVTTDFYGNFEVINQIADVGDITVDCYGNILDSYLGGDFKYYSDFNDYEAGKIKKVNNINFTYYSNFNNYEAGKIKKIDNINFSYYSNFNNYETGKLKKIGDTSFTYYSNFNDYEAGKTKKIGNTSFIYYSNFNDYEAGKIKQIGSNGYTFLSGNMNEREKGRIKSGRNHFNDGGISFRIMR